jgi:hypothetical protein
MAVPSHYGTPTTANGVTITSLTISSHTVGSATDRVLYIGIGVRDPGSSSSVITGITWNGTENLTQKHSERNGTSQHTEIWTLVAPTETTADIVISFSTTVGRTIAGATNYQDVNQSTPVEANAGSNGTGSPASTPITTVNDNALLVDTIGIHNNVALAPGTGQTERWEVNASGGSAASSDEGAPTAGGYTQTYSWSPNVDKAHAVIALSEVGAGGGPTLPIFDRYHRSMRA